MRVDPYVREGVQLGWILVWIGIQIWFACINCHWYR